MAKVELKQPVVDEIKGVLDGAQGAVIVDYRGLTVEQDTRLRKQLREAGVIYKVYKNARLLWPYPRKTPQLPQEFWPISPRLLPSWS